MNQKLEIVLDFILIIISYFRYQSNKMNSELIHRIVILGTGNVAVRLSLALKAAELEIVQVYGRNKAKAKTLADKLNSAYTDELNLINHSADLYILCISDDALEEVIKKISFKDAFLVHTSGTTRIEIFGEKHEHFGVFYPLQTFSESKEVNFKNIPFCIEASTKDDKSKLITLAKRVSDHVQSINSEQRKTLHIAAVFASNFTNYFYSIAADILKKEGLSFDLLKPLIQESAAKILSQNPENAQTGPARRGDHKIIAEHLKSLDTNKDYKDLYELISKLIKRKYLGQ